MNRVYVFGSAIILLSTVITSNQIMDTGLTPVEEQEILEQGLNEYIDPSESPIYNQEYVEIKYKKGKEKEQKQLEKDLPKKEGKEEGIVYYEDNSTDTLSEKKVKSISINLRKEENNIKTNNNIHVDRTENWDFL